MYHYSIKCLINILIMNYLVQFKVDGKRTIRQANCFNTINAYYEIPLDTYKTTINYAKYAILHFRKCKECASGIKLVLSKHGIPENPESSTQAVTLRGSVKKVNDFDELMGKSVTKMKTLDGSSVKSMVSDDNQRPETSNSFSVTSRSHMPEKSSTDDSQRPETSNSVSVASRSDIPEESFTVLLTKVNINIHKIPDDVINYYLTMAPYVTAHCYFKTPAQYCLKYLKPVKRKEPPGYDLVDRCTNQIIERFQLKDILNDHHSIIQKLYSDYVIGELYAQSEKYAIEYIEFVSSFCKMEQVMKSEMLCPASFCRKIHPA